mmetsp:Transcript_10646/g.16702  ORF Transcript_10646/g.16702 Transcript_10646/m.16702 type:complete len:261 (+) Transcript_10646:188-970(+)
MFDNPYHNWFHAVDVTQTVYCFALHAKLFDRIDDLTAFALITSALCHDLEHPGVNNPFLIATHNELAVLYNDKSVLENYHCCRAFQIMANREVSLLEGLPEEDYFKLRRIIITNILATDMARHAEYMSKLKAISGEGLELETQFEMEILMKCADTSNVVKPFNVAKKWATRVTDEFFLQGDKEREKKLPVTSMCNRETQGRVALQKGFIDYVVGPFYDLVGKTILGSGDAFTLMAKNRETWNDYDDDRLLAECAEDITDP